ncbi:3-dehydroquinate synthase [Virgibacillus sp. C22-A2]|uniref:3-dehydroquinate synthase n=1 Tax=Virgibacillus tibetensis TaxID=3042313 RepID=A0ABU6KAV9_9BACI|nr:3-dehydroquinate synthase [Virgibacillus sp. C22-A2]
MDDIIVKSSSHSYAITIGENVRFLVDNYVTKKYSSILVVSDKTVADLYANDIMNSLKGENTFLSIVPVGEQSKDIRLFYQLHTEAINHGLDRQSLIIALGGGVIGDLAGFVASTYMRGIDYIQLPTTILAHDSSVGGKVAINHELGKNLIGSFYPPKAVIYDTQTLQTLSEKEVRSGYAELIKEALIADGAFLNSLLETDLFSLSTKELEEHLRTGIKIKATIVEEDEKEAGNRKYLNLGHTLGHALETELGYGTITHGEAVAIGLLFSIHVSELMYATKLPYNPLLKWFKKNHYPLDLRNIDEKSLLNIMKSDKKIMNKMIQMVLLKDTGQPTIQELDDEDLHSYLKSFITKLSSE